MRRATIFEYDKLADKLSGYVGAMNFQFMDLCVKAEPVALLNVRVIIEGEAQKLEECTRMGKTDDYHFMIIPNYDEDLKEVAKGILMEHPEFKVEGEQMTVDFEDGDGNPTKQTVRYLNVTMPEVNDDRYKVLKDGVNAIYEATKSQMKAANAQAKQKFSELAFTEEKEELDKLDSELKKLNTQWNDQRDSLHNDKLQEIEDAHNKWLADKAKREQSRQEANRANDPNAALSMNMPTDNNE